MSSLIIRNLNFNNSCKKKIKRIKQKVVVVIIKQEIEKNKIKKQKQTLNRIENQFNPLTTLCFHVEIALENWRDKGGLRYRLNDQCAVLN